MEQQICLQFKNQQKTIIHQKKLLNMTKQMNQFRKSYPTSNDAKADLEYEEEPQLLISHLKQIVIKQEGDLHRNYRQIYPMLNNTFIILRCRSIFHVNKQGIILKAREFQNLIKKILPMTQKHVLLFEEIQTNSNPYEDEVSAFKITQWDLQTDETISLYHYNIQKQSLQILGFNQTSIFCIVEQKFQHISETIYDSGAVSENQFFKKQEQQVLSTVILTYYKFPLQQAGENLIQIKCFKATPEELQRRLKVFKMNSSSKIGIVGTLLNFNDNTFIKEIDLETRSWKTVQINLQNMLNYDKKWFELKLTSVCEYKKNHYYLKVQALASKSQYLFNRKLCDIEENLQELEKSFSLVWNLPENKFQHLLSDHTRHNVQFTQSFHELQNILFIPLRSFQTRCLQRKANRLAEAATCYILPVYYVDNLTHKILSIETSTKQKFFPMYKPNEALQVESSSQSIQYYQYKAKSSLLAQQTYTFLLTEFMGLNNIDEKLVTVVVELLQKQKSTNQKLQI